MQFNNKQLCTHKVFFHRYHHYLTFQALSSLSFFNQIENRARLIQQICIYWIRGRVREREQITFSINDFAKPIIFCFQIFPFHKIWWMAFINKIFNNRGKGIKPRIESRKEKKAQSNGRIIIDCKKIIKRKLK